MSRSLEAALVLSISLTCSLGIVAYEVPFLRAVQGEAKQLKVINDRQVAARDLYQVREEANPYRTKAETTPYVSANPQKAIEAVKLAEDLLKLKERRHTAENAPINLPPLPPGQELPQLPGLPQIPELAGPSVPAALPTVPPLPALPAPPGSPLPALPAPPGEVPPGEGAFLPPDGPGLLRP